MEQAVSRCSALRELSLSAEHAATPYCRLEVDVSSSDGPAGKAVLPVVVQDDVHVSSLRVKLDEGLSGGRLEKSLAYPEKLDQATALDHTQTLQVHAGYLLLPQDCTVALGHVVARC